MPLPQSAAAAASGSRASHPRAWWVFTGGCSADSLSLQQLPLLLPELELLVIEGGMWEQRAVRDALQLVRTLERQGSKLPSGASTVVEGHFLLVPTFCPPVHESAFNFHV